jgi:ribosomal protein L37AE/L43A
MNTQTLTLLISTTGIGFMMVKSGLVKNALEVRRRRRICPSCGREIHGRTCTGH